MSKKVLITGGAGFVGTNLADWLLRSGTEVLPFDNLSRRGMERNLRYLRETHGDLVPAHVNDIRDKRVVEDLVARRESVFHFAARAFNLGGGPDNAVSLLAVLRYLAELTQVVSEIRHGSWRKGDQPYCVSDARRFNEVTGWAPQIPVEQSISQIHHGLLDSAPSSVSQAWE